MQKKQLHVLLFLLASYNIFSSQAANNQNPQNNAQPNLAQLIQLLTSVQASQQQALAQALQQALNPNGQGLSIDPNSFQNIGQNLAQGVNQGGGLLNFNFAEDFGERANEAFNRIMNGQNGQGELGEAFNRQLRNLLRGQQGQNGLGNVINQELGDIFRGQNGQNNGLGDVIGDQLRNLLRGQNGQNNGLGRVARDEIDNLVNGVGDQVGNEVFDGMDGVRRGLGGLQDELWGWRQAKRLLGFSSLFAIGTLLLMVLYYKLKKYFLTPAVANAVSSFFHIFKKKKYDAETAFKDIQDNLILNPEELLAIKDWLYEVEIAIKHKLPLPNLLLAGIPGTGKTRIAQILQKYFRYMFLSGSSLSKFKDGEEIVQMDGVFSWKKKKLTNFYTHSLVFIDEIEAFLQQRSKQNDKDRKLFQHFLSYTGTPAKDGVVIGATNDPSELDDAVHRRFPTAIVISAPNETNRSIIIGKYWQKILSNTTFKSNLVLNNAFYLQLAKKLPGATGADIEIIVGKIGKKVLRTKSLTMALIDEEIENYHKSKKSLKKSYVNLPGSKKQQA